MANFTNYGTKLCEDAGKILAESFANSGKSDVLKENFGISFKESQTTSTNDGAYTDLLATTLYTAAIDKIQKVLDLVEINEDLKNKGGFGAMQLPRLTPTIAYEVSEGEIVTPFDEGIDAITVTCKKVVAGTAITWEILKRGMTDFAKYVVKNAADAVTRKLASDIVNGLSAGAADETSGGVSYSNMLAAEEAVNGATYGNGVPYGFIADALVLNASSWATFRGDSDVKEAIYYASAVPGQPVNAATMPLMFGNMEIVVTPFLTHSQALVLEKKKNVLVKESDLETFEGQIPGRIYDREIVALMSYVLAIIFPASIRRIVA